MDDSLHNKYTIVKKIGEGAFGSVFKACLKQDPNTLVAIKIENKQKEITRLKHEKNVYSYFKDKLGFPYVYDFIEKEKHFIFVMEYLGPNLEELFEFCGYHFSLKTILMIAIQVLNRIETFHNSGFIHRDIKPDNFLIGIKNKKSRIYLIDFGLSKKFVQNRKHISYNTDKSFTGSYRYSSIRNHKGIEQSRRDDLESIGYMFIYFLTRRLPWQGLKGEDRQTRKKNIFNVKKNISPEELCEKLPHEFLLYMKYCRVLKFKDKPNYKMLKDLFVNLFKKRKYQLDFVYDWNIIAKKKKI